MLAFCALAALSTNAHAEPGEWRGNLRLQTSYGGDSNVYESLEEASRRSDQLFRLLIEGEGERRGLPLGMRASLGARGFREDYRELTAEKRAQGEVQTALTMPLSGSGAQARLEAGLTARSYPDVADSLSRDYDRGWITAESAAPLGPSGIVHLAFRLYSLDFDRTSRPDEWGSGVDLSYEHPLRAHLWGNVGLEFVGVRHGSPSIQWGDPDEGRTITVGPPDHRDNGRHVHVGVRWMRRLLVNLQYGYRAQNSNSLGSSFHRHEVRWLVGAPLPLGLTAQTYGNLEHTDYTDAHLDEVYIFRGGEEVEARDDNNQVVVGVTRQLVSKVKIELRHGWYRNESLLLGSYYRKAVWTLALGWESGRASAF